MVRLPTRRNASPPSMSVTRVRTNIRISVEPEEGKGNGTVVHPVSYGSEPERLFRSKRIDFSDVKDTPTSDGNRNTVPIDLDDVPTPVQLGTSSVEFEVQLSIEGAPVPGGWKGRVGPTKETPNRTKKKWAQLGLLYLELAGSNRLHPSKRPFVRCVSLLRPMNASFTRCFWDAWRNSLAPRMDEPQRTP